MERNAPDDACSFTPHMANVAQLDGSGESLASTTSDPSHPQHRQVAISRNPTNYERPERARTSHACEPCRERKTKCDGGRPSCRRCLHTNVSCHYGYGKGWKKRKTVEDLTATSAKLARYEALLDDILPLVTDNVRSMIEHTRLQEYGSADGSDAADSITPGSASNLDIGVKSDSPLGGRLPPPLSNSSSASTQWPLPRPSALGHSLSPTRSGSSIPRSDKSSPDDMSSNPALRLPS